MNIADIAQQGDFDTLLRVVDNHPNVDQTDVYGGTALMYAVAAHRQDVVEVLLSIGADAGKRDQDGRSARDYATVWGCSNEILKLLRK